MSRISRTRGRHCLPGAVGRRPGRRLRRGGVHDGDDGLPGDGHRPELRRPARRVHGADDRQLRRRRLSARVGPALGEGRADAPLRRGRVGAVARVARDRGAGGHRHPQARAADPGGGRDARRRCRRPRAARSCLGARPDQGAAGDGGPGARLGRLLGRSGRLQRGGAGAGGGRRLRREELDHAPAARRGRRGDRVPAHCTSPTTSPASTASCSRTVPATRSR